MKCSICGRLITLALAVHKCAIPIELGGMEDYSVWGDPKHDGDMKYHSNFKSLEEAVKYARKLMKKYSASAIMIMGDDEDGHFSCTIDEINEASTENLKRSLEEE